MGRTEAERGDTREAGVEGCPGGKPGPPPQVSPVSLFSYLVTRHTGRAVRLGIEERLAEYERQVLAVVDFREVQLIDFSCADEIVVKLILGSLRAGDTGPRTFFLFSGMARYHVDPVASALRRQGLAVAAERADGRPALIGSIAPKPARAWHAVCRLGRADVPGVAARVEAAESAAGELLEALHARRLLLRDGAEYLSFRRALEEARSGGGDA